MIILSHIYTVTWICSPSSSYAHHLLCACWHSEAVMGSSSLSCRRLLISLWVTSPLFLCPEPTDAPCLYYGGSVPPFPRWRPHSQGPHTLPFQGTRQYLGLNVNRLWWDHPRRLETRKLVPARPVPRSPKTLLIEIRICVPSRSNVFILLIFYVR